MAHLMHVVPQQSDRAGARCAGAMLGARDPAASGAVLVGLAVHEEVLVGEDVGDVLVQAESAVLVTIEIGHEILVVLIGGSVSQLFLQKHPDLWRVQHAVAVRVQRREILAQGQ